MDELGPERSDHVSFHQAPPYSSSEDWWKTYETSISLGFLATAVFISMFIIMAIIEHLYKLNASFDLNRYTSHQSNDPRPMQKLVDPQPHVSYFNILKLVLLMIYVSYKSLKHTVVTRYKREMQWIYRY